MKTVLIHFGKFITIACAAIIAVLCVCLSIVWIAPQILQTLTILNHIFSQNILLFTFFRWIILLIFYCCWPWLVRQRSQAYAWTEKKENYWLQQRVRVIIWLVIFEILVCENLLWGLWQLL